MLAKASRNLERKLANFPLNTGSPSSSFFTKFSSVNGFNLCEKRKILVEETKVVVNPANAKEKKKAKDHVTQIFCKPFIIDSFMSR